MAEQIVRELVDGEWTTTYADIGGGGGAQPDVLTRHTFTFQESAGAGTYTASLVIPAGTWLLNGAVRCIAAPWDADTAPGTLSDVANGDFFTDAPFGQDGINKFFVAYDPTDGSTFDGSGGASIGQAFLNSQGGVYPDNWMLDWHDDNGGVGVFYDDADEITMTVISTGAGGTTGRFTVTLIGFGIPTGTTAAMKT